jgi:hypothetical protein
MMLVDAPARQNASAMHTSASSRSNSGGGGLNGSSQSDVSIHERGKRVDGALFPIWEDLARFYAISVPAILKYQRKRWVWL